jgi:hypothetical protein
VWQHLAVHGEARPLALGLPSELLDRDREIEQGAPVTHADIAQLRVALLACVGPERLRAAREAVDAEADLD